ncbi:hypothetical protein E1B28_007855 [Marasmius oreades]|uniref:F-box domain-containing protein n=1 Tax=Marasmius oreades TaxID=181124 RepID=A0A9P7UUG0_9AGAR|nr:uncharacterized protein E1B28_007855 [Marasmius oreades]KAG7094250.1 hypothetical protein E1B28_007855 [Marasmius oreades]
MQSLPEEIYAAILQHLPLQHVLKLRQVSNHFRDLTYSRDLWIRLLREETKVKRRIPVPRLFRDAHSVNTLSTVELERCVQRSLKLYQNWSSPSPVATRKAFLYTGLTSQWPVPGPASLRIISLHFVTLSSGRSCLLSVAYGQHLEPRTLLFELWDISGSADDASCVAWRDIRLWGGYAVNTTSVVEQGILAVKTPGVEIWGVDLSKAPDSAFVTLKTLSTEVKIVSSFTGTTLLVLGLHDEVKILDIRDPSKETELRHPQPLLPTNQPHVLESIIEHDYIVIVRPITLELYSLEAFRRSEDIQVLSPVIVHTFQWRLDSCRIERDIKHYEQAPATHDRPTPINILVRFSSLFPWPVNLLQHYVLHPNRLYTPLSGSTASTSPRTTAGLVNINLPFRFPPTLHQTISSPIRLFAISDMAVGIYGTAVWIDSHTEEYFLQGETGQRLAGLMLSPATATATTARFSDSEVLAHEDDGLSGDWSAVTLPPRPDDLTDEPTQSHASAVFDVQESDDWNRVAVDECEGRVAVGSINGRITLYEYI